MQDRFFFVGSVGVTIYLCNVLVTGLKSLTQRFSCHVAVAHVKSWWYDGLAVLRGCDHGVV